MRGGMMTDRRLSRDKTEPTATMHNKRLEKDKIEPNVSGKNNA
jgi:hypothetical protein